MCFDVFEVEYLVFGGYLMGLCKLFSNGLQYLGYVLVYVLCECGVIVCECFSSCMMCAVALSRMFMNDFCIIGLFNYWKSS